MNIFPKHRLAEIPGFPGYFACENGSIWSTKDTHRPAGTYHRMVLRVTKWGYLDVGLSRDGKRHTRLVHILILNAFVGPCPRGMQTRHLNGDALDCRLQNLTWGTPKENTEDKKFHGTHPSGFTHPRNRLSEAAIREILTSRNKSTASQLSQKFGVSVGHVRNIRAGCARSSFTRNLK